MNTYVAAAVAAGSLLLASCGASGSESSDGPKPTATTIATTTTGATTTAVDAGAGADADGDGQEFQGLIAGADKSVDYEAGVRDGFAEDGDVAGAAESASDLRFALNLFDEDLRDLEVPPELQEAVNEVLTANGAFIEVLDGYAGVTDAAEYNDQLEAEADARIAWYDSVNAAADAFGTSGIESDFEPASGEDEPADATIAAGEIAETGTASMEVPEGFEATAAAVIEMENSTGARIGLYTVTSDAATLEDVAEQASKNGADKDGYEITGGPEEWPVGSYDAIAYYLDYGDGVLGISLFFEAEDSAGSRWHVLSVEADEAEIEEVGAAVDAVLDTVTIT